MKKPSDELLNKYIDGELDEASLAELKEMLAGSDENMQRLRELQAIDRGLKKIKEYKVSNNFTFSIMNKIKSAAEHRKSDKRFIIVISSVFLILCLGFIAYAFCLIVPEAGASENVGQNITNYVNYLIKYVPSLNNLLNSQNISIIGSVFSLGLLITGYFFFESQKSSKRRMGKFN